MTEIKAGTKKAQEMQNDLTATYCRGRTFEDVYKTASTAKSCAWYQIKERAENTPGYNHDLHITGASSHFFSTIYSYIEDGITHIIRDTHTATYHTTILPA